MENATTVMNINTQNSLPRGNSKTKFLHIQSLLSDTKQRKLTC